MSSMYIELEKEIAALAARRDRQMPLDDAERALKNAFERARYASFHRPHGCITMPCAACRGARIPYNREER